MVNGSGVTGGSHSLNVETFSLSLEVDFRLRESVMGCEEGQGYFFGRPMPVPALEEQFLAAKRTPERAIA